MLIISASAPRSGSSWYFTLQNALLVAAGNAEQMDIRQRYNWLFPRKDLVARSHWNIGTLYGHKLLRITLMSILSGTFAVKTHEKPTRGLRILTQYHLAKSTYIFRDPRDRLVSIMNVATKMREQGIYDRSFGLVGGFDDALDWVRSSYQHYEMWRKHPQTLMVRYEDLVLNCVEQVKQTRDFLDLDLSDRAVSEIVQTINADVDNPKMHYIRGQSGNFRKVLTDEQLAITHATIGDQITKLGYEV